MSSEDQVVDEMQAEQRSRVPSEGWYDYQEVTAEEMIDVIGRQTPLKQAEHSLVVEELNSVAAPTKAQSLTNLQPCTMIEDPFGEEPNHLKPTFFDQNETACFEQAGQPVE